MTLNWITSLIPALILAVVFASAVPFVRNSAALEIITEEDVEQNVIDLGSYIRMADNFIAFCSQAWRAGLL